MAPDEKAAGSDDEPADLDGAERTDEVAALPLADAQRVLGENVVKDDLDEQPTKKMGALSAEEAQKVAASTGKRRSVRVFKHPSKPPPRLELPLATAQHQAVDYASVPADPTSHSARRWVAVVALILSFALGAVVAWATHEPFVTTTPLTPRLSAPERSASPPPSEMRPSAMSTTSLPQSPIAEVASEPDPEPDENEFEQTGPERAEELLEAAQSLRGNELRATLEEAAQADPANPHAASGLAEFHMEVDPHEALEWALQASQLRRRRASYRDLVADAYDRIGNSRDAARARAAAAALRESD